MALSAPSTSSRLRRWLIPAVAIVVLVAILGSFLSGGSRTPEFSNARQITFTEGREDFPVWAPDGEMLAFAALEGNTWDVFVARPETGEIINRLCAIDDRPWGEWKGRRITPHAVAKLLRPFGVEPDKWKEDGKTLRGYRLKVDGKPTALADAFDRYLQAEEAADKCPEAPPPSQGGVLQSPLTPPLGKHYDNRSNESATATAPSFHPVPSTGR